MILQAYFTVRLIEIVNLTDAADKIRLGSTLSDTCKWSDVIRGALRIAVDDVQKIPFKNFSTSSASNSGLIEWK